MNKRKTGSFFEDKACAYLISNGFRVLCRNYRTRSGEIDIIGYDRNILCFVEVKFRSSTAFGESLEAVDRRKQLQIIRIARQFLYYSKTSQESPMRFDVVGVDSCPSDNRILWIKNAFEK